MIGTSRQDDGTNYATRFYRVRKGTSHRRIGGLEVTNWNVHVLGFSPPTLRSDAFLTFRVQYGQPLDIPLDENGQCHTLKEFYFPSFDFDQLKLIKALKVLFGNRSDQYRIEPNWNDDPRLFLVEVVRHGKVRRRFLPGGMIDLVELEQYLKDENI